MELYEKKLSAHAWSQFNQRHENKPTVTIRLTAMSFSARISINNCAFFFPNEDFIEKTRVERKKLVNQTEIETGGLVSRGNWFGWI